MEEIKIIPLEDLDHLNELRIDAYPGFTTPANRPEMREKLHKIQTGHPSPFYGYYRNGQLLGSMRLFDFTMNLYGQAILVGGLASVAVHLLHKKEQIAKKMVEFFLQYYRDKGASFTFLYAFRPDFYKKMGFGYGTRTYDYRINPSSFLRGDSKKHLLFLYEDDAQEWINCHNRIAKKTHGMIYKTHDDYLAYLNDPSKKIIGFQKDGCIQGYMVFSPQKVTDQNVLTHHFVIHEWQYETSEVLQEFLTFLHSQADQFERVVFQTQDDQFYYLLADPRNHTERLLPGLFHESHRVGLGMMPRIVNSAKAIQEIRNRTFGNESVIVQFNITDNFLSEKSDVAVSFKNGTGTLTSEPPEVTIYIDIANYSSLLFGAVSFKTLHHYGLITLSSSSYVDKLGNLLDGGIKPICTVSF